MLNDQVKSARYIYVFELQYDLLLGKHWDVLSIYPYYELQTLFIVVRWSGKKVILTKGLKNVIKYSKGKRLK